MIVAAPVSALLADLLMRIGSEFAGLADEVEQLQHSLSPMLRAAGVDPAVLEHAQVLDRVQQYARQLAEVVMRTALQAPHDCPVTLHPVLEGVSLSALSQKLSGRVLDEAVRGEVELL
jgi:hypothetical protein